MEKTYNKCKKVWFPSRKAAKKKKIELNRRGFKIKAIYYCDICKGFHHTSYTKEMSRGYDRYKKNQKKK